MSGSHYPDESNDRLLGWIASVLLFLGIALMVTGRLMKSPNVALPAASERAESGRQDNARSTLNKDYGRADVEEARVLPPDGLRGPAKNPRQERSRLANSPAVDPMLAGDEHRTNAETPEARANEARLPSECEQLTARLERVATKCSDVWIQKANASLRPVPSLGLGSHSFEGCCEFARSSSHGRGDCDFAKKATDELNRCSANVVDKAQRAALPTEVTPPAPAVVPAGAATGQVNQPSAGIASPAAHQGAGAVAAPRVNSDGASGSAKRGARVNTPTRPKPPGSAGEAK